MIRAHVEQAEMTVIAQGGKAKGHIVLLDDPAMVLAQLAGKPRVMGALAHCSTCSGL
jgi:hypothetical protein